MDIRGFRGKYSFLSNFYSTPVHALVIYNGHAYYNTEAAFQAQKCPERMCEFVSLNPSEAKHLGRYVPLRSDWDEVKDGIMYEIVLAKFTQNERLRNALLATGDANLIETNNWGDRYWGEDEEGNGENHLGKTLEKVRENLSKA